MWITILVLAVIIIASLFIKSLIDEIEARRQEQIRNEQSERNRKAELERIQQTKRLHQQKEVEKQKIIIQKLPTDEKNELFQSRSENTLIDIIESKENKDEFILPKQNWKDFKGILNQKGINKFYHFTDIANIPSIKKNNGLYSWWRANQLGIDVPMPGGIGFGRELDKLYGLENYVRICFTKNHPMLYVAKKEGRIKNPIILEIDISVAFLQETRFSNMNATKTGHKQGKTLDDLKRIRFDLLKLPNHFDIPEEDKHFYQAEVLVLEKIPLKYITNINQF
jgi:hypothetical protein